MTTNFRRQKKVRGTSLHSLVRGRDLCLSLGDPPWYATVAAVFLSCNKARLKSSHANLLFPYKFGTENSKSNMGRCCCSGTLAWAVALLLWRVSSIRIVSAWISVVATRATGRDCAPGLVASAALFQYRPALGTTEQVLLSYEPSTARVGTVPDLYVANEIVSPQPLLKRTTTARVATATTVGPDPATKPDYENLVGPLGRFLDGVFLRVFRDKLAEQVLGDVDDNDDDDDDDTIILNSSSSNGTVLVASQQIRRTKTATLDRWLKERAHRPANYTDIVQLAAALNARFANNPVEVARRARLVLQNLFPPWLPAAYAALFSRPFPGLAARMNARVTAVAGVWLMGECTVNDVPLLGISSVPSSSRTDSSRAGPNFTMMGRGQGVLVTRCRFLEESQCASVCVNSCKLPTQSFFLDGMGLPLVMEPDYATGSCQFSFGRVPDIETERAALATPCLSQCPTAGSYRIHHGGVGGGAVESRPASSSSSSSSRAVSTRNLDAATLPNDDEDAVQVDSLMTTATTCYMMGTTQS
jgi:hypothetical protein